MPMNVKLGLVVAAALAFFTAPHAPAQETTSQSASPLEFDVVSIRVDHSDKHMSRMMQTDDGLSFVNVGLTGMVAYAWNIDGNHVSGAPAWSGSTSFDLEARVAGSDVAALKQLSNAQRKALLQPVLKGRFGLKLHSETKIAPVFELVVAKGGEKLTALPAGSCADPKSGKPGKPCGMISIDVYPSPLHQEFKGDGITVADLAMNFESYVHRIVIDRTGLSGNYDVRFHWAPEAEHAGISAESNGSGDQQDPTEPSLFTAIEEQLGLRLQSTKAPIDTLVIDAAHMPAEN